METMQAFMMGEAHRGSELRVFDWIKAATIIASRRTEGASAGLSNDWEWTGGEIWRDSKPVPRDDTYTYLASTWATPELEIGDEIIECWRMQSETLGWDAHTYWPPEALRIALADIEGEVVVREIESS